MIYCIWYPSGGFGHFINAMISLHGKNFYRPKQGFKLSENGNSHDVPLVIPRYRRHKKFSMPELDPAFNYSVLIDNGIDDEDIEFLPTFPGANIIKVCYDDRSWPVVAYTHIIKAMNSRLEDQLSLSQDLWPDQSAWAQREKFFLYLRDHSFRHSWRPSDTVHALPIACLYDYLDMKTVLSAIGIETDPFDQDWAQWRTANAKYLEPVLIAQTIVENLENQDQDLSHIQDVWTQAVIYYYLWLEFDRGVPHNDYANFFKSTGEIRQWVGL